MNQPFLVDGWTLTYKLWLSTSFFLKDKEFMLYLSNFTLNL